MLLRPKSRCPLTPTFLLKRNKHRHGSIFYYRFITVKNLFGIRKKQIYASAPESSFGRVQGMDRGTETAGGYACRVSPDLPCARPRSVTRAQVRHRIFRHCAPSRDFAQLSQRNSHPILTFPHHLRLTLAQGAPSLRASNAWSRRAWAR